METELLSKLRNPAGCILQTTLAALRVIEDKNFKAFPTKVEDSDETKTLYGWLYKKDDKISGIYMSKFFEADEDILGNVTLLELEEHDIFLRKGIPHQITFDEDEGLRIMEVYEVRNSLEVVAIIQKCYKHKFEFFYVVPYFITQGDLSLIAWYCCDNNEDDGNYVVVPFFSEDIAIFNKMILEEATVQLVEPGTPFKRGARNFILEGKTDGTFFFYDRYE